MSYRPSIENQWACWPYPIQLWKYLDRKDLPNLIKVPTCITTVKLPIEYKLYDKRTHFFSDCVIWSYYSLKEYCDIQLGKDERQKRGKYNSRAAVESHWFCPVKKINKLTFFILRLQCRGSGDCHQHVCPCGRASIDAFVFRFRTISWKAFAGLFLYCIHTSLRWCRCAFWGLLPLT